MTPVPTMKLKSRFPKLYDKIIGFSCGDGWYDLIHDLSIDLMCEIIKMPVAPSILKVWEHKGRLSYEIDLPVDGHLAIVKLRMQPSTL